MRQALAYRRSLYLSNTRISQYFTPGLTYELHNIPRGLRLTIRSRNPFFIDVANPRIVRATSYMLSVGVMTAIALRVITCIAHSLH